MHKTVATLALALLFATALYGQAPSTPEQRRQVVEATRWLEENPLHADRKVRATELFKWWTEVPDLTLTVCPLLIETKNKKVAPIVAIQALLSSGAYLIEHSDATRTDLAMAGVEGALRAYGKAVAADAKMRDKFLDRLLAAQREGKLAESYVTAAVAKCEQEERAKR